MRNKPDKKKDNYVTHFDEVPRAVSLAVALAVKKKKKNRLTLQEARDPGSSPGSGRSSAEGRGTPLQHPCLENLMDKEPGGLRSIASQRVGHD